MLVLRCHKINGICLRPLQIATLQGTHSQMASSRSCLDTSVHPVPRRADHIEALPLAQCTPDCFFCFNFVAVSQSRMFPHVGLAVWNATVDEAG
jgi:hypothetical protein